MIGSRGVTKALLIWQIFVQVHLFMGAESPTLIVFSAPQRPAEYEPNCSAATLQAVECSKLPADCLDCDFPADCRYDERITVSCRPNLNISCQGKQEFTRHTECKFCYQTIEHVCAPNFNCSHMSSAPNQMYRTVCWPANQQTVCKGRRAFYKNVPCNWTSGYKWSTAFLLSVTLGGFGADRFYLGLWRSGLGKLFSFGGIGVWTVVDVILIGTGYIGPADGSIYMP